MNCAQVRELLPLHLYGDETAEERSAIDAHIAQCPACAAELSALAMVRRGLDSGPGIAPSADIGRLFRAEADRLRRRSRRWRATAALAIAATVLVLALRLDIRVGGGQLTVRWGTAEPIREAPSVREVVIRQEATMPPELDDHLKRMSELIAVLASSTEATDRERARELTKLKADLTAWQRLSEERLSRTERDVSALYTAQFGSRSRGVNP
jgi:hypothetical protein